MTYLKEHRVICVHLLNDFSGSPKVFMQAINALVKSGTSVDLYTSRNSRKGFLSDIDGVRYYTFFYRWSRIKVWTLILFFVSQFLLFFRLLKYWNQSIIIYVNTALPFGAALAGKLMRKPVIYHIHETSVKPPIFKKFLFGIIKRTATIGIYVSNYLRQSEPIANLEYKVIYNALPDSFVKQAKAFKPGPDKEFNVLLVASLKAYKGVNEYVELAALLPEVKFTMVLNATRVQIDAYFQHVLITDNLIIFDAQWDIHPFYQKATVVLNLSHPEKWVETFGLTALEAMAYGLPVIVPPVGGIAEIVDENVSGFKIDVRNLPEIKDKIEAMQHDSELYGKLSNGALRNAARFNIDEMETNILRTMEEVVLQNE